MQRSRIAANKQPASLHQRAQLCEVELTYFQHPRGGRAERLPRGLTDACGRLAIRRSGAQDDSPGRGRSRQLGHQRDERSLGPSSEWISGTHMNHDQFVSRCHARRLQAPRHLCVRGRVEAHLHRILGRRWAASRPRINRVEEVPLIHHRVPPAEGSGPRNRPRVHPRAPDNLVANARRRSGQPRQPRTAWPAVQIDRDVVPLASKATGESQVIGDTRDARAPRGHDHLVQMRIAANDCQGLGLDEVRQVRVRKPALQRPDQRRRKHDVANQPKPD
jgi:hypothetical protein